MNNQQVWAIVPAAGIGSRMQADRPKQYLQLNGKFVLQHTLERLASHPRIEGIIVAVSENDSWWPEISINTDTQIHTALGGAKRADSVFNALLKLQQLIDDDPWLLIHDAARPCLRHQDIDQILTQLIAHPIGGILGIPVNDTMKRTNVNNQITATVERQSLWRALTPQMFQLTLLKEALALAKQQDLTVTDEASAMQLMGLQPMMVEGYADNIKITVRQDLALASLFLTLQNEENR